MPEGASPEDPLNHVPVEKLERLLDVSGVLPSFIDYSGQTVVTPLADRVRVLAAMGLVAGSEAAVDRLLAEAESANLRRWSRPVTLAVADAPFVLRFTCLRGEEESTFQWCIDLESGERLQGAFRPASDGAGKSHEYGGDGFISTDIVLEALPAGYHRLHLALGTRSEQVLVIAAPGHCHEPEWLAAGRGLWGVSVQLYTLCSARNRGMGDFADLNELITRSAAAGADFVLLNPLHALHLASPWHGSPYSPTDRRFLNPLYIAPDGEEDFTDSAEVSALVGGAGYKQRVQDLMATPDVDYPGVTTLKYRLFDLMFRHFLEACHGTGSPRDLAFSKFVADRGEPLAAFATCQAAVPLPGVAAQQDPRFHCYLQWLADRQLSEAMQLALAEGMQVGIIRDLAVGSYSGGCEVATNPALFCLDARIGAPPDDFNSLGQNWGLPPLRPDVLEHTGFRHFITLLRENMRACGALRIDHVMSLMRLWWSPGDGNDVAGAYVRYPVDILFAILRLESRRARCLVIGEDLGVVPPEIRRYLDESGLLSNTVFYFEKVDGVYFKKPEHYPRRALAFIANHDVPTLKAWWNLKDLALRRRLGLFPAGVMQEDVIAYREHEKRLLLQWLDEMAMLPAAWQDRDSVRPFDIVLCCAIFRACGATNAQLVSVQLDDLAGLETPVNIPGTDTQYANWRRKLAVTLEALFTSDEVRQMLDAIKETRDGK